MHLKLTPLILLYTGCVSTKEVLDAALRPDSSTITDVIAVSDSTTVTDTNTGMDATAGCGSEFFSVEYTLHDGRTGQQCLPLRELVLETAGCSPVANYATVSTATFNVQYSSQNPGAFEPPWLNRAGEHPAGMSVALDPQTCGFRSLLCPRETLGGSCCYFRTYAGALCRWRVQQPGTVGQTVSLELVGQCSLVAENETGDLDMNRRVTVRRASVRGVLRHRDLGVAQNDDGGQTMPFDCTFRP